MNATTVNWSGSAVGRPTADTLTDRYVWAVLKALPEAKRVDIDRELRATIADDMDARVASGEEPVAAERAVLLELGDPARLAASYLGRTLALIGPELYPGYVALLKMLYAVVLPLATVVYFAIQLLVGAEPGGLVGGTIAVVLSLVVHLGFWTTLVFAIAERAGTSMKNVPRLVDKPFDPDQLPTIATNTGAGRSDLIASLVVLLLTPLALVWLQFAPIVGDAQHPIAVFHPGMLPVWLTYFVVVFLLSAGFAVLLYRTGRWTWLLVILNAALGLAVAIPIVALIWNDALLNRTFLAALGGEDLFTVGGAGVVSATIGVGVVMIWAIVDSVLKTVKADRLARRS